MAHDTTSTDPMPSPWPELQRLWEGARLAFYQERTFRRALTLMVGQLLTVGRRTLTELLRSMGLEQEDWTSWYRLFSQPRFSARRLARYLLTETMADQPADSPYAVTVDGVIVSRTGRHVAGVSWWRGQNTAPFSRGLQRGQRFVEVAWLTPEQDSYRRAIPLYWRPAVTDKAVPSVARPLREWQAGLLHIRWVRRVLDQQGRADEPLVVLADGNYDVQAIWPKLPAHTTLLVRTAANRKLLALPEEETGPRGPGRPPLYGPRAPTPKELLRERQRDKWTLLTLKARGREVTLQYRLQGPYLLDGVANIPLFLIVVRGRSVTVGRRRTHRHYRKPYFGLVNAVWRDEAWRLPFPVEQLLAWAWQRWECEVAHREIKSELGVGEQQSWSARGALTSVQWGVFMYGMAVLAGHRTWGVTGGPRRSGRWYRHGRRWSFAGMWQALRAELLGQANFRPLDRPYVANWLKPELWRSGQGQTPLHAGSP